MHMQTLPTSDELDTMSVGSPLSSCLGSGLQKLFGLDSLNLLDVLLLAWTLHVPLNSGLSEESILLSLPIRPNFPCDCIVP